MLAGHGVHGFPFGEVLLEQIGIVEYDIEPFILSDPTTGIEGLRQDNS
jgi:hypothetical protein